MRVPKPAPPVAEVFQSYPPKARKLLLAVRKLIFETAARIEEVGELTETLKWGEPAYLTEQTKSGSTIRLAWKASQPDKCGLYFICSTTLVSDFRSRFEGTLQFEGNRELVLSLSEPLPDKPLRSCIEAALTYHLS